ncbi:MAG: sodium:solute symporter family protein [Candidatus Latescibacteria bacterium]|nr:sodium:solute symporter family protein [Candidatus Latescibacterota bacterium]
MDAQTTFTILDWVVLIGYFVGITVFGLWISRKIKTSGAFFLGERKLPWWIMIGQAFGTGTHAENPVAQTGSTFHLGFATIWYQWKNMLITPFYWLLAPWYRRSERTTIAGIINDRYGRKLALVYTIFAIAFFVFNQGAMLKGAGKVISVATGGNLISPNGVVVAMTASFILYSVFGGLIAAAYTDFIQGFLIITLSFMLIPAGLNLIGGFAGMRELLSPENVATYAAAVRAAAPAGEVVVPGGDVGTSGFFTLYSDVSGMSLFVILMLALNGVIGITAMPHMLTMCATGKDERSGRMGQTYGSLVKRLCTVGWALTGLIAAAIVVKETTILPDSEHAFGYACLRLLGPGFVGLLVASVLAANMSTCSNFMINTGALFTENLYKTYLRKDTNDHETLIVGRLSGLSLTMMGVVFALYVDKVLDAFLFTETLAALMGIMFISGFLWKRANRAGAWAATIGSFTVYYALNYLMTCQGSDGGFRQLGDAWSYLCHSGNMMGFLSTGELKLVYHWMAAPYGLATLVGFICLIVVSLLTKQEDPDRIEKFFDNQLRSTDFENMPAGEPKPLAADIGHDLVFLDLPGWFTADRWRNFWKRYHEDVVGFLLAWLTVGALVFLAWALMQVGA